ncbi:MAG: WYL domain-containing protein [Bacteroidales bacterium]|nr:WYL domain-containing protein [Bacteroidales bacterium]
MPLNKDQMLRYRILNACFKDTSRLYDINALVDCCQLEMMKKYEKGVSKRSIHNDIHKLQYEPYNVEFDEDLKKRHYYRYADTSFNLTVVEDLSSRERTALHNTVEYLRPICEDPDTATPLMQWMFMSLQRLEAGEPLAEKSACVSFENNESLAGMGNFNFLLSCIMGRKPVTLRYRSFRSKEAKDINVYPYYLKQYNGRWYLLATPERHSNIAPYALDRILTVNIWETIFIPTDVDFDAFFADMIGVTTDPNSKVEQIVLRIDARRYPYVETKPFSEKQKIVNKNDNTVTITFPMHVNVELVSEILSFGSDIEVLEPLALRQKIAQQIELACNLYSRVQKDCTPGQ